MLLQALERWIVVLLLITAYLGSSAVPTIAQGTESTPDASPIAGETEEFVAPKFTILPIGDFENGYFDIQGQAGDTIDLTARIVNTGTVPATLRTFATNAYNPENGGFAAGTDEDAPIGATLWLDYPEEALSMQPGDEHIIAFSVAIPENTPPGEYVAALVVQTDESLEIPGSENLRQILRNTMSVEITIPGDMTAGFELGTPEAFTSGDQWVLDIPITNTGTARVRPQGQLLITSPEGDVVSTTDVAMGSVYGGNSTTVRAFLPGQLPLRNCLVSLDLTDEATGASGIIENTPIAISDPVAEEPEVFVIDEASVTPNADPIQYADVAAVITNNGPAIPTANVTLTVMRDGDEVERYPLAQNQALPQGTTDFSQRYIPVDGWQPGTWSFELVISAVSGTTETVLATVEVPDEITVP